jgi:hypothetical protein
MKLSSRAAFESFDTRRWSLVLDSMKRANCDARETQDFLRDRSEKREESENDGRLLLPPRGFRVQMVANVTSRDWKRPEPIHHAGGSNAAARAQTGASTTHLS